MLREAAQKKKLADFETFAQIWVGGSGKNLIQKIDAIETKYLWEGGMQKSSQFPIEKFIFISLFSAFLCEKNFYF